MPSLFNAGLIALLVSTHACGTPPIKQSINEQGVTEFSNHTHSNKKVKKTIIYKYPQSENVTVFTNKKPSHLSDYAVLKFDCFACNPKTKINWQNVKLNLKAYKAIINDRAAHYNVDPALVRAIIHAESAFKAKVTSTKGAQGLMQLMPGTARILGVRQPFDPQQNIDGGVHYLAQLLEQFKGDVSLATASYNAGPQAIKKYNGIPPYKETQVYVKRVSILHQRYEQALQ